MKLAIQRPERYAERHMRDVPTPECSGVVLEGGGWSCRYDWEGLIVVEYWARDPGDALIDGREHFRAAYLLAVPHCINNAPWGLA